MVNKLLHKTLNHFGYKVVTKELKIDASAELRALFGIDLHVEHHFHCHKGWKLLRELKDAHNASLHLNEEQHVEIKIGSFVFEINTWEEIFILYEIFIQGTYNLNISEDFLFIDIGMNVGFTSIYFSELENCKNIIAFEPFDETIISAQKNIALNRKSAYKIAIHHTGLGYPARKLTVDYSYQYKGSVGINGIAFYTQNEFIPVKAELCIADVSDALGAYVTNTKLKKVVKIDCEGAEYEIIERLAQTSLLNKFDILMIEWHIKGPSILKAHLSKAGFTVLSFKENSNTTGMLYAFKNR